MMMNIAKFWSFLSILCIANGAKILGIVQMPSYSHFIMADRIYQALAARGHEVTVISPFEQKVPVKNMRHIALADDDNKIKGTIRNKFSLTEVDFITNTIYVINFGIWITEAILNNTSVQTLLKSEETFDLVIYEKFLNEAFSGFAYHYKAPCIITSGLRPSRWVNRQMGNPSDPSYIPDMFLGYSSEMDFFERAFNAFIYVTTEILDHTWRLPKQNEFLQKYFPGAPHVLDLFYNVSLALVNSHVSVNPAVPIVPNVIEIGGYHLQPPKPLSKDWQEYLDSATEGVIYFSMGSAMKSTEMTPEKRDALVTALGKLKQQVLWKWEDDVLPNQPPNVKVAKWVPQQDILAHPNIKLFITHGGLLGTMEAVYSGVPVLGIPIYGDQDINIKNAEHEGYGLGIKYTTLSSESLSAALHELLNNPKYMETAKRKSKIMHDQPTKPLDRAVYWIEYVIRHEGAPHLRTAAVKLNWYQYLLLDVALAVLLTFMVFIWIVIRIIKLFCCKAKTISKSKKTN